MQDTDEIMDSLDEVFDFAEEDGDHTDLSEEEVPQEEPGEEPTQEASDESESEETSGNEDASGNPETPAEGSQEPDSKLQENEQQFITVKYDSETRNISLEDAPGLIQKGLNYERLQERMQEQLDTAGQEKQTLQAKLDEQAQAMGTLELIAQTVGVSVPDMLEQLHINAVKGTGKTEAEARAIIRADKLERQLKAQGKAQAEKPSQEDARTEQVAQELTDFRKQFPNVNLEDPALVERLRPYIQSGMSLTTAYLKQENQRQAAEIVRLQQEQEQKQAAQEQNRKNRAKAPGSMQDSGGGRTKDLADLFEEELFR